MSDILTRLLLNTSDYDSKLKKAKGSTTSFADGIGGKAASMVGKFAAGIGIAMGGVETFNKLMTSSQTVGDKYAETMAGIKNSVNEFFTALGTGDFTAFNTGLDTIITKAREAYRALDQLGNARMSFDIAQALSQRDIQEGQLAAKNKFAPVEVAIEGFATWRKGIDDMIARTKQLTEDTKNYITSAVEAEAGIKGFNANMDSIMQGLLLDIQDKASRNRIKREMASEYEMFKNEMEKASEKRVAKRAMRNYYDADTVEREYRDTVKKLTEKYNKAITINALLNKYSDDELKAIGDYIKSMISLDAAIRGAQREFNETAYEFNNRNKSLKGFAPIESFEGYTVYSGPTVSAPKTTPKNHVEDFAKKLEIQAMVGNNIQYNTPLGQKLMQSIKSGEPLPVITQPVEIEEVVEEDPLPGLTKKVEEITGINEELAVFDQMMSMVNGSTAAGADNWLQWMNNVVQATSTAVTAIRSVVAAKTAEGAASAGASAAQSGPFGWLAIAPAIMSALAAFASIPKFADGGIIGGSSYFGDKLLARVNSGEMILNQRQQSRLLDMTDNSNVRVSGDIKINGKDIYIALRNYMKASNNTL